MIQVMLRMLRRQSEGKLGLELGDFFTTFYHVFNYVKGFWKL